MPTYADLLEQGTATPEEFVRAFANEHPTPHVKAALGLCEDGTLTWEQVYRLFAKSLAAGLEAVR